METTKPLWATCVSVQPLPQWKDFFFCLYGISCISVCVHCIFFCWWAPLGRAWIPLLHSLPSGVCTVWWEPLWALSLDESHQGWVKRRDHLPQPSGYRLPNDLQGPSYLQGHFAGLCSTPRSSSAKLLSFCLAFSSYSSPEAGLCISPYWSSRDSSHSISPALSCRMTAQLSGISAFPPSFMPSANLLWVYFVPCRGH